MKFKAIGVATVTAALSLITNGVSAVFSDEAYVIDWAKDPIGYLNPANTAVVDSSDGGLIIGTFTDSSVLASINSIDGTTIWRRWFGDTDRTISSPSRSLIRVNNGLDELFVFAKNSYSDTNSSSESTVSAWDPITGVLEWEATFSEPITAINGITGSNTNSKPTQVFVLLESGTLVKLDPLSGAPIWLSDLQIDSIPLAVIDLSSKVGVITSASYIINVEKADGTVHSRRKFATSTSSFPRLIEEVLAINQADETTCVVARSGLSVVIRLVDSNGNVITEEVVPSSSSSNHSTIRAIVNADEVAVSDDNKHVHLFTIKGNTISKDYDSVTNHKRWTSFTNSTSFPISFLSNGQILIQDEFGNLELYESASTNPVWTRHDGLTEITSSVFVDFLFDDSSLSEEELLFEENANIVSAFTRRLTRHLNDIRYVINKLIDLSSSPSSSSSSEIPLSSHTTSESHDNLFGFHKLLVVASANHHVYALDTTNEGTIVWSLKIPISVSNSTINLAVNSGTVYVITSIGEIYTVDVDGNLHSSKPLPLQSDEFIDEIIQIHETIFASSTKANIFTVATSSSTKFGDDVLYFTKLSPDASSINGYLITNDVSSETSVSQKTWKYSPGPNYHILATAKRSPEDLTTSIGKVLGDRSVLYKYLHRNAIAIAAVNKETKSLIISIIDTVTGRVLHSKIHEDQVLDSNIHLVYGEHWIVYSFYSTFPSEGQKIVVWDLYESNSPNERQSKDDEIYSSFDSFSLPHVKSQAFFFNEEPITSLSVSRTRYGITSRDIILTLGNGKIATLPKTLLDARRPIGRAPTKEEQEEGLTQYNSVIFLPPVNVLSHARHLLAVNHIISEPATLESTSLIAGFGKVDLFFTRITPSRPFDMLSNSFEKPKLIYTVVTLLTATVVVRKFAQRKIIDQQWGVGEL